MLKNILCIFLLHDSSNFINSQTCPKPFGWSVDDNNTPVYRKKAEIKQIGDPYGHLKNGYESPWDFQYYSHTIRSLRSSKKMGERLINITSSSDYVILDLRTTEEKKYFDFKKYDQNLQNYGLDLKAHYAELDYDLVRYSPHDLFTAVNEASGKNDLLSLTVPCNDDNPINQNRDQPLLIMCGDNFCGCRYMYATWNGFTNVTTIEKVNKFLPPSVYSPWKKIVKKVDVGPVYDGSKGGKKFYGQRITSSFLKEFLKKYNEHRGIK